MTPESHGDNYYYHLHLLYLPWCQETEDLLDEYSTAQEVLSAKKDKLQFFNAKHGSFADEIYRVSKICPNAVQETLDAGALESEFDPLYERDVNIEENALEVYDANHQEATTNDNGS